MRMRSISKVVYYMLYLLKYISTNKNIGSTIWAIGIAKL